jgi:hypothetical protein
MLAMAALRPDQIAELREAERAMGIPLEVLVSHVCVLLLT